MSNKPSNQSKLRSCIRAPLRFLRKAMNLYVRCMYQCTEWASHGHDMGLPPVYFSSLPISSNTDDLRDLIRANSKSNIMNRVGSNIEIGSQSDLVKVEIEILQLRQQRQAQAAMAKKVQRRKCCAVIGTIDEDKPCEFGDDLKVRSVFLQQPRSRSCAVTKRISAVY